MKITNEIFNRYMNAEDKEIITMTEELGFENPADFEEEHLGGQPRRKGTGDEVLRNDRERICRFRGSVG